jgi:hypothetical protein
MRSRDAYAAVRGRVEEAGLRNVCERAEVRGAHCGLERRRVFDRDRLLQRRVERDRIRDGQQVGQHAIGERCDSRRDIAERGMTPAEAVDYMVEHLPIERPSAEAEVRRYCAWPTYQLSYAVGRRELLRLRDAYQKREAASFDPRRFHDELMSYGGIPVSLARWGMDLVE